MTELPDFDPHTSDIKLFLEGALVTGAEPYQIYHQTPMLTMVAQTLGDYLAQRAPLPRDQFELVIQTDSAATAIHITPVQAADGSLDEDTFAAVGELFFQLERIALKYALATVHVDKDMGLVGTDTSRAGYLDLLKAIAEEEGAVIGPETHQGEKICIGPYRLCDIESACEYELKNERMRIGGALLGDAFSEAADPAAEKTKMLDAAERFLEEIIQKEFGDDDVLYNYYAHGTGYRHVILLNTAQQNPSDCIEKFFERLQTLALPGGIVINAEDFIIRSNTAKAFEDFTDAVIQSYADERAASPGNDLEGEEIDGFWPHPEPENALHACALVMQGITEHLCDIRSGVRWYIAQDADRITMHADFDETDKAQDNVEFTSMMLDDISQHAGDWGDFSIDLKNCEIQFRDMRTFCNVIDHYFKIKEFQSGRDFLNEIELGSWSPEEFFNAAEVLEQDPTLSFCLPQKIYASQRLMGYDAIKLLRIADEKKNKPRYAGPVGTQDVMRLLTLEALHESKPASLERLQRVPGMLPH